MINYLVTVVIYNKKPLASSTLVALSKINDNDDFNIKILLWDNSPQPFTFQSLEELSRMFPKNNCEYKYNNGENRALSKIYNDTIAVANMQDIVVIMDDDSEFSSELFVKSTQAIKNNIDINLFLPIVKFNNLIVSPAYMRGFKGSFLKEAQPGFMQSKNRTAINSGMIIRASYLKTSFPGYDESIKFYGTDNDFMDRHNKQNKVMFVLDYVMNHELNFYSTTESFEKKAMRVIDQNKSLLIIMRRRGLFMYYLTKIYLFLFMVKYAIIHKNIKYLLIS